MLFVTCLLQDVCSCYSIPVCVCLLDTLLQGELYLRMEQPALALPLYQNALEIYEDAKSVTYQSTNESIVHSLIILH